MSEVELNKIKSNFSDWEQKIEALSGYIASSGKRYKFHYATLLNWSRMPAKQVNSNFNGKQESVDDEGLTVESRKFLEENPLWKPGTPKFRTLQSGEKVGNWLGIGGYNVRGEKYQNKYAHLG
ncbi:MAG: hypothetical protein LBJ32_04165 [Oscillospiraceae bacterium]|nr:hypothetical protein [Oscillospiraceae bacterium]